MNILIRCLANISVLALYKLMRRQPTTDISGSDSTQRTLAKKTGLSLLPGSQQPGGLSGARVILP